MLKMALVLSELYIDCVVLVNILINRVDFKESIYLMVVFLDLFRVVCMIFEIKFFLSFFFGRFSSEEVVFREVFVEGDIL